MNISSGSLPYTSLNLKLTVPLPPDLLSSPPHDIKKVEIKKTIKKGDDVSLIGFGTFTKVKRAARTGINPATGEKIKIKAKTLPKFKPGKAWKEML